MDADQLLALDRRVTEAGLAVVSRVTLGDLGRATPCAEWTLRELLEHMTTQHHGFAAAARGGGADHEVWRVGSLGEHPVARYTASVDDVLAAFAAESLGRREFALPEISASATFPAAQAIGFHLLDGIAHGWDVARALDVEFELDTEVLDVGWRIAAAVPDGERRLEPGASFRPATPGAADVNANAMDRIVASLGRSPGWPG